jgi:hypothetical protein
MSKSETRRERLSGLVDGVKVTYEGHLVVPEDEQVWEIHLRPKHEPPQKTPSPDTRAAAQGSDLHA